MLLRRFTHHLKDQNWFAVGLDVIVVIVGIFLGMQVTEWNEQRNNAERETLLVKNIIEDLRLDSQHISQSLNELANQLEVADKLIAKSLDSEKSIDYESAGLVRYSSDFRPISQRNHAEAVSKLKNEFNREILQNYFIKEDRVADIFLEYESIIHNKIRPYLSEVGMHNLKALYDQKPDGLSPVFLLPEILDEQLDNVQFQQLLFERRLKTGSFNVLLKELQSSNLELIQALSSNNN